MVTEIEARSLKQAGVDALRRGDFAAARERFEHVISSGNADGLTWLGMAAACRRLNDANAAIRAVDKVLELEPKNVRALIMKGDHLIGGGDVSSGVTIYREAIASASASSQIPADLIGELRRAEEACNRFASALQDYLQSRLNECGFDRERWSGRFTRSLDILHGRRQIFLQQPRLFYFAELPQIQFYDRALFPWLDAIEAATSEIRDEAEAVLDDAQAFSPYVTGGPKERPKGDYHGMLDNPDWSAFYLYKDGDLVPENGARCPKTLKALEDVPLSRVSKKTPSVLFSLLRPGARIPAHTGFLNTRLICHLPLIVPQNCGLRVGNEVRDFSEGKAWVFDDTIEHEAWNLSGQPRVILLFDIWRPELSEDERKLVAALLEAVDSYGAAPTKWGI